MNDISELLTGARHASMGMNIMPLIVEPSNVNAVFIKPSINIRIHTTHTIGD